MNSVETMRARLVQAGLERHADALLDQAAWSIRLCPREPLGPRGIPYRHTPVEVRRHLAGAVAIAGNLYYRLALISDGSVMAWGGNDAGQLGDGTRRDRSIPVEVRGLDGVTAIAAGTAHNLALRDDGSVVAWGDNRYGELGDGTRQQRRKPVAVRELGGGVIAVAAGREKGFALRADGSVVGWGLSVADPFVGIDQIPDRPIPIPGLTDGIVAVSTYGNHHLALTEDGAVLSWGENLGGRLGDGTTTAGLRLTPAQVSGLSGDVTAIAAGNSHSLALLVDGSVVAWGEDHSGALGDRTADARGSPVPVLGLGGPAVAIAAGLNCSFALMSDGAALAWGWNYQAQLGDGSTTDRYRPVPVRHLSGGVRAIAPGTALRVDGAVLAWGGEDCAGQSGRDHPVSFGETRLGGNPDVPLDSAWPSFEGRPMAFVAQVNLAEVEPLDPRELLPPSGLLSFFCSTADLEREGSWHVAFTDAGTELRIAVLPQGFPASDRFGQVGLRPQRELTPIPSESAALERLGLSQQDRLAYGDALDAEDTPRHRMLGHPDVVQHDPRDDEPELCLLFQVDSDQGAGMEWGDVGRLYFWIHPDDLRTRRFERVRLEFQSH